MEKEEFEYKNTLTNRNKIFLRQNISPNQDKFSDFVEYSEEAERLIEPQAVKPDWLCSIIRLGAAPVRRSFATPIQNPISKNY